MVQPFLISIFLCAVPANNALGEKSRAVRRLMQMKEAVEHAATHDSLTSLANRSLFLRKFGNLLRSGDRFAVLYIDLDRFKVINDTMGHSAGDELLRAFSERMLAAVDCDATVARFGGDEFALLVPGRSRQSDYEEICRNILDSARTPFLLSTGPAHVSASIGMAVARSDMSDPGELLRRADIALYAVKAAGRDGYRLFYDEHNQTSQNCTYPDSTLAGC